MICLTFRLVMCRLVVLQYVRMNGIGGQQRIMHGIVLILNGSCSGVHD